MLVLEWQVAKNAFSFTICTLASVPSDALLCHRAYPPVTSFRTKVSACWVSLLWSIDVRFKEAGSTKPENGSEGGLMTSRWPPDAS